jgi:replicative DNA helicase
MKEDFLEQNLDTLQKFGPVFQAKVISCFLSDKSFLEQTFDIVVPHYFENNSDKWIIEKLLWYYSAYKNIPTPEVFKQEIDKEHDDIFKLSIIDRIKMVYRNLTSSDLTYVKDEFLTFCKNQSIKNAVLRSADLIQRGKYDDIKVLVDRAMHAGQTKDIGHDWNQGLEDRLSENARKTVATPWGLINGLMDGGLGPGELGCVVAPSGLGKTWVLCALGAEALRNGLKVAHYTFELSQKYVGTRYDSVVSGIEPNAIRHHREKVSREIAKIDGELKIKYFPTRSININHISAHMKRMSQLGFTPDLVLIDYADLMRSTENVHAKWEELGYIYEEIRGMLGEFGIPGWTASQAGRSSLQDDVIEADKIAGAYSKVMTSDFVMSVSRKIVDKNNNTARIHVMKNRFGPDGLTFPTKMDLAHGQIEVFDENSPEGMKIKQLVSAGSKSLLNKRIQDTLQKLQEQEMGDAEFLNLG